MDAWERFWMCVFGCIVCGAALTFINMYANDREKWGYSIGYKSGFSDSRGGYCDTSLVSCARPPETKAETK